MILARFAWYRRARGGYWAQVTGFISGVRWVRCKSTEPTPDHKWIFYPWATKEMGNGYIDEWHSVEPCWAVPFSSWVAETIGTNDMACVLGLISAARNNLEVGECPDPVEYHPCRREGCPHCDLVSALLPFKNAKTTNATK